MQKNQKLTLKYSANDFKILSYEWFDVDILKLQLYGYVKFTWSFNLSTRVCKFTIERKLLIRGGAGLNCWVEAGRGLLVWESSDRIWGNKIFVVSEREHLTFVLLTLINELFCFLF